MPTHTPKELEKEVQCLFEQYININTNNITPINNLNVSPDAFLIFKNALKEIKNEIILKVSGKPEIKFSNYGGKSESKCDIVVETNIYKYKISIKKDNTGILISTNSPDDFLKIFSYFQKFITDDIGNKLKEVSKYIKKIPNYSSYSKKHGSSVEEYMDHYIITELKDRKIESKYLDEILKIGIAKYKSPVEANAYKTYLHSAEGEIQALMVDIFTNHTELAKRFIHECATGYFKFLNNDFNSDADANMLVDKNHAYIIGENDYDNLFILDKLKEGIRKKNKFRLRNVSRTNLGITKLNRIIELNDLNLIEEYVDSINEADLTFKF